MLTEKIKISKIKGNPDNPRIIKDDRFKSLVQSIKEFPEMLELRPIVVDKDLMVLGGNMRLKACKELKLKDVYITKAENLTDEQKKEFIIKDNASFGEWDYTQLSEWDNEQLNDWGLENWNNEDIDYSLKNKEIDIDMLDMDMILKLKYNEDEYNLVKEQLSKIASTPEQAVWKLLSNE